MVRTTPDDDNDIRLLSDIQSHGWHLVAISDDEEVPAYVFSVGIFHSLGQPEICIFGLLDTKLMGQIISVIGHLMKSGAKFRDWDASSEILDGYSCIFREVDRSFYREHFGYARWFHQGDNFPMLQCVWPDGSGRFPWESDFDSQLVQAQPILATKSPWPFADARNAATITTRQVLEEGYPILVVSHDDDGTWQFVCGTTNETDDGRVVALSEIVENHPSVIELADLPIGWQAMRENAGMPWQRTR